MEEIEEKYRGMYFIGFGFNYLVIFDCMDIIVWNMSIKKFQCEVLFFKLFYMLFWINFIVVEMNNLYLVCQIVIINNDRYLIIINIGQGDICIFINVENVDVFNLVQSFMKDFYDFGIIYI